MLTISQIRNLSRLVWINVAIPPADDTTKGKSTFTAKELRRKKVETIKLCVSFAFAVKHYLRGEDGLDWEDYVGILPPSVARLAQPSSAASRKSSALASYAATASTSRSDSGAASRDEEVGEDSPSSSPVRTTATDATKRIRVKRSKDRLKQPGVRSSKTPLLNVLHQTIDFNADPDSLSTPLPLVYVSPRHFVSI